MSQKLFLVSNTPERGRWIRGNAVKFYHAGRDYREALVDRAACLRRAFRLGDSQPIIPFNPVVTDVRAPVKAAYFGLSAYCRDADVVEALRQRNFAEWCQGSYNTKIFSVLGIWKRAITRDSIPSAIYYTNFVKLVLPESNYFRATDVRTALRRNPDALEALTELAVEEIAWLQDNGCDYFVAFGWDAFNYLSTAAEVSRIQLIRERHFSRYSLAHTESLLREIATRIQ